MNNSFNKYNRFVFASNTPTAQKVPWWNVGLVLLLLCFSGNPAVFYQETADLLYVGFVLFLTAILLYRRQRVVIPRFAILTGLFAVILLIQCVSFSFFPVITIAGFFVRLFIGYAVIRIVRDFPYVYVRAMVLLAIISLLFHVPYILMAAAGTSTEGLITHLSTVLHTIDIGPRRPLFLHTFMGDFSYRNAGIFWEPGAFAGYLALAFIFLYLVKDKLSKILYARYMIILSIALLSTLSTTGYIVYPFILLLHYIGMAKTKESSVKRIAITIYLVLPLMAGGSFVAYNKLPFLREKVEYQLNKLDRRQGRWQNERIGSIVFDWEYIRQRPLTGWGLHFNTRYSLHPHFDYEELSAMGNGMSDFTAKFGVIGMLIWLFCVFQVIMHLTKRDLPVTLLCILIICLVLQGECFLGYPLFLGLMFLPASQPLPVLSKNYVRRNSRCQAKTSN